MSNHAILTRVSESKFVVFFQDGGFVDDFPSRFNMPDLCAFIIKAKITHLWIHADTRLHFLSGSIERLGELDFDCLTTYAGQHDDEVASMHAFQKYTRGQSQRFNITFLEHSSWDWQELQVGEIFEIISDLEMNLEVNVGSSSTTGTRYLTQVTRKRPQWLAKPETDLSTIPWNEGAKPLIWKRTPTREELACKYLYALDKNSAHGRAAKEEEFGYGEPEHRDVCAFDASLPGMWYVEIDEEGEVDALLDHIPFIPSPVWGAQGWYATPIVKCLVKMGIPFQVKEAWVFPNHAHIYRGWIENLWEFRREREGYLRDAYKSVMNDTLGLLRSDKLGTDSFKYRPDHYMTVVAGTRAAMMYNIISYAQKGYYPIMCQIDALYYCSDHELPNLAVDGILNHTNSLGGYKVKFKLPMDAVTGAGMTVRALLASTMPQSRKLRFLNYVAEDFGY